MTTYKEILEKLSSLKASGKDAHVNMNPEHAARMRWQNQFQTGVDIAKYTAAIMRKDMDAYDADSSAYTQSL